MSLLRQSRNLLPVFLRQLDHYWLIHRPFVWTTRIHIVAYYGLIGLAVGGLLGQLPSVSPAHIPEGWHYFFGMMIPVGLGLCYWVWRSASFHPTFPDHWSERLQISLLYFLGFFLLVLGPITAWTLIDHRVQKMGEQVSVREDARIMALGWEFFKHEARVKLPVPFYQLSEQEAKVFEEEFRRIQAHPTQRAQVIADFQAVAQRYCPRSFPDVTLAFLQPGNRADPPYGLGRDIARWIPAIGAQMQRLHQKTYLPNYPFSGQHSGAWWVVIWVLILPLCGLLLAFVQVGWEGSLGLLAMTTGLGLMDMMLLIFFQSAMNTFSYSTPWWILLVNVLALFHYGAKPGRFHDLSESLKQVSLILGLGGIYFLVLFFPEVFLGRNERPSTLYLILLFSGILALWIGTIQSRLLRMKAQPKS